MTLSPHDRGLPPRSPEEPGGAPGARPPLGPYVPWSRPRPASGTGPLNGVRLAVKDVFAVAGTPTGAGHPRWRQTHAAPARDADALARLTAAGASVAGVAHTDELAYSLAGTNAHYGAVRNPAAPARTVGGSSSGTAAAVAAGLADLGLGTDTAGSIRVPAAWTGLYALRPTHARTDRTGAVPLAPSFDVPGLMARHPDLLRAGAGLLLSGAPDPAEPLRLLLPEDLWRTAESGVREALAPLAGLLAARLAPDRTAQFPEARAWARAQRAFSTLQAAEAWDAHGTWISRERPSFGPGVAARWSLAARLTKDEVTAARRAQRLARDLLLRSLREGAVLAIPTTPRLAPALRPGGPPAPPRGVDGPHETGTASAARTALLRLTCLAPLAGLPALTVPAGRVDGCPVGLCLIGAPGTDEALLRLAAELPSRGPDGGEGAGSRP
ncbi:amidase family protein [Streptomyces sp. NPDC007088]|uniref:amidase family protein n=1 Tax=Streptomyces sp. NPDC007088 TaxID=3364773 RepID=UPI0036A9B02A